MAVESKKYLLKYHSNLHLRIEHAAVGNYPVNRKNNHLTLNRLLMIFKDSGRDDSYIQDLKSKELFPMRSGLLYFIPCHHEILSNLTENLFFVSLQFNLDLFYGFDVFRNYGKCVKIKNPSLISETKQLINKEDEIRTLCRINEIIFNLCVSLLSDHPNPIQKNNVSWRQYERILDFVQKSGDATTTVAKLADMSGMRQDVFSRKFTRDMRVTPKEFIDNTIVRKASQMLLSSSISVQAVSEDLNFSSECYFSRFFKKHTGLPPHQFRIINGGS